MGRGRYGTCRWCGAQVLWLTSTSTAKPAPIDPAPTPDGNIEINMAAGTYSVVGAFTRPVPTLEDPDPPDPPVTRRLNHWATCRSVSRRQLAKQPPHPFVADADGIGCRDCPLPAGNPAHRP